mgnify:CR=1 FL=1
MANAGYEEVRQAIAENLNERFGTKFTAHNLVMTVGAAGGLNIIFKTILDPDDEVIVFAPFFGEYRQYAANFDAKIVIVQPNLETFQPDLADLESKITARTKALIVNTPNNPTGAMVSKAELQKWVDYANKVGAIILYDAAYEAYISEKDIPHSIYECEGARTCAIEMRSFSKNAGFTGMRLGFTVIPKDIKSGDVTLHSLWARRHGTKYNGAPYIIQRAGEAVYSPEGKAQLKEQVAYYMKNAKVIYDGLKGAGYTVSGGVNAPYIWLKTPGNMTSWEFFDHLLADANVVGTPGSGFGPSGEGYFRLTAFGTYENTVEAVERIKKL